MILLLLFACHKTPVAPKVFAEPFPAAAPPPRPAPVPLSPGACAEPREIRAGDVLDCDGILVTDQDVERNRHEVAELVFWRDTAQACELHRKTDRARCEDRFAPVWLSNLEAAQQVQRQRGLVPITLGVGFVGGAAVTVAITYAVTRATEAP